MDTVDKEPTGGVDVLSRYDAVLSALDAGVVVHAADTQILDCNERARDLLGIVDLEGRLASDPTWAFLEADGSPMPLERFPVVQVLTTRAPLRGFTAIIQPPDAPPVWVVVNAAPLLNDAAEVEQVVVTFIDISSQQRAEALLSQADDEARVAFDQSRIATCLVSNDGRLSRVNRAMCEFMGRTEAELHELTFLDITHPEDRELGKELVADILAGRIPSFRVTKRYVTGNGRVVWGDITVTAVHNPDGTVRHRIAQIVDVTREHALRESLLEAERIAHLGSWQFDAATGAVHWSPELFRMFGLDPEGPAPDFVDQEKLFAPESWQQLTAAVAHTLETGEPYELELELVRADGIRRWGEARGEVVRDANGTIIEIHGISLDITERRAARDALRELATHDPLTGLANRVELLDEIGRAIAAGHRAHRTTAVLMLDLDRFKAINDTLGHALGDQLLIAAAGRLGEVVRDSDLVARLGGDEFVVVMRDLTDASEAIAAAERIVKAFRAPFALWGRDLFSTASVGVTIASETSAPDDLLREADTAMYAAKESGRDRISTYNEDLRTAVTTRMSIESDLRLALGRQALSVWYQPEIDLATGTVVALEALLRWRHPDSTVWTAERFVEIAEDTGLILDIGDWVLRRACEDAAAWSKQGPDRPLTVRVNVSAVQLAESGLIDAIDEALSASGLSAESLCVEITETALLRTTLVSASNLGALHARGISLAIDDFGTGYASLTYLHQYPVDVLKIDRSFVSDSSESGGLVAGIIALARTLGIQVTAEGIETPEQAQYLHGLGCPSAQGWLYSAAVPAEDVPALLQRVYPHG